MKNIEKLINECIKMEQSIVNDVFKVDVFKCKKELEDYKQAQNLQLQQTGVKRCSYKDIDKFYNDTMYTDQTNYYGIIQRTKKGDYVKWKQPSQMIKDFMRWKKNNA